MKEDLKVRKRISKLLVGALLVTSLMGFAGCGNSDDAGKSEEDANAVATEETATSDDGADNADKKDLKVGAVMLGDENEGYTFAHIDGIKKAAESLGMSDDQIVWKYSVPETAAAYDAAADLVDAGCNLIVSNSYGHQSYMKQAAEEFPDVTFVAMTGDTANQDNLPNFKNAFTNIYESRYVSGVVAGVKIKELMDGGKLADNNKDADGKVKVGYVGAYPYAEVVSGYTAFFLGIQSIVPDVTMEVQYTNSWFDINAEGEAAKALMADGCVIIGQHADSTGAPSAVEEASKTGTLAFSVGYNVDMLSVAPDVALTSATNNWSVYYAYAFKCMMDGEDIATDWAKGYADDAVAITELGSACAEGTQEAVDSAVAGIKDGSVHVFDTSKFTVEGKKIDSYHIDLNGDFKCDDDNPDAEAVKDGYFHESELRAAPSFDLRIDGIKELN